MHSNPSTNDRPQHHVPDILSGTVGSSMIVIASLQTAPATAAEAQRSLQSTRVVLECATTDTQRSSTVKAGLLQGDAATLISDGAKAAIGTSGLKRLQNFFRLQAGWDGSASKPIDLNSISVFSSFFAATGLRPNHMGVFMSAQGNVVVNWPDRYGQLVELEFHSAGVDYFIETGGEEGTVGCIDIGFSMLLKRILENVEA